MSDDVVISVEGLSKRYHSLRDIVVRHGKNFARKTLDMAHGQQSVGVSPE